MKQPAAVSDYLSNLDNRCRVVLAQLDRLIRRWQPQLEVKLWQSMGHAIIGYGRTSYRLRSGKTNQWFIIGLAAYKSYFSLYIWGVVDGQYLLDHYQGRLGRVKAGRACLNFKDPDDLNLTVLEEAVQRAVDAAGELQQQFQDE